MAAGELLRGRLGFDSAGTRFRDTSRNRGDRVGQLIQAHFAMGLDRHDGNAQLPFQSREIEFQSTVGGDIHHVHRQHHRQTELEHLAHDIQVAFQIARVDDADHHIQR